MFDLPTAKELKKLKSGSVEDMILRVNESLLKCIEREEELKKARKPYMVTCRWCKTTFTLSIDPQDLADWKCGHKLIQHALPYLSKDERELLVSGTCGKCWDTVVTW